MPPQPYHKKKCKISVCRSEPVGYGRGLCAAHYKEAKTLVENNSTTWEEMERLDMIECKNSLLVADLLARRAKQQNERPG